MNQTKMETDGKPVSDDDFVDGLAKLQGQLQQLEGVCVLRGGEENLAQKLQELRTLIHVRICQINEKPQEDEEHRQALHNEREYAHGEFVANCKRYEELLDELRESEKVPIPCVELIREEARQLSDNIVRASSVWGFKVHEYDSVF